MNTFTKKFTWFVNTALKILFLIILIGSAVFAFGYISKSLNENAGYFILVSAVLCIISAGIVYLVYKYFKKTKDYKRTIFIILAAAFILRLIWMVIIKTVPSSDFLTMYNCGADFIRGDYSGFKGTKYIARFSHLTILTIYLGFIQEFFSHPIAAYKLINIVLSTLNVFLIYLICAELYDNKDKGIWAALVACLFPPFIFYNTVACSENIAMPFFLASTYIFMVVIKNKKNIYWLILSGVLLSIGNLFRMVGYVMVAAYIMYIIIYCYKKNAIKSIALVLISFLIPLYLTNALLIGIGITEYPLWKGREPSSTSILKGTNINTNGSWNFEDSNIVKIYNYDYKAIDAAAKAKIKQRLTTTPISKLAVFYIRKFSDEWCLGDFSAVAWSTNKVSIENTAYKLSNLTLFYCQIFYMVLMVFVYRGLFNKKNYIDNKPINLFYIIFCGYGILYLITEQQARYAYIACWIFIILAFSGRRKETLV